MRPTKLLVVNKLTVRQGGNEVLRGVSLTVGRGEIVALLGRSGSGKSTLLRAIATLQPASAGDVLLDGDPIMDGGSALFEESEIRRHIMVVPQMPALLPHLTVLDNIALGLIVVRRFSRRMASERARGIMVAFGIDNLKTRYPRELSGGQAQRAQLARVAVMEPSVLLLDEVTSSLDTETANDVMEGLWTLRACGSKNQGMLIVTHQLEFARTFADRVLRLENGIVSDASVLPAYSSLR